MRSCQLCWVAWLMRRRACVMRLWLLGGLLLSCLRRHLFRCCYLRWRLASLMTIGAFVSPLLNSWAICFSRCAAGVALLQFQAASLVIGTLQEI
jgi:hypothetical protein